MGGPPGQRREVVDPRGPRIAGDGFDPLANKVIAAPPAP